MDSWEQLLDHRNFLRAEAEMLAATAQNDPYGDNTESRARFYESWGDLLSLDHVSEAIEKYNEALELYRLFASWSTSGGEGTARMRAVNRVLAKIEALLK
jgi:hypothetical protein